MKIAFLASRFPYPLDKGDKVRTYHQLKDLSRNNSIYLFCITDKPVSAADIDHIKSFCAKVYIYPISKAGIVLQLMFTLFSTLPFQSAYFYRKSIRRAIYQELESIKPDAIICQLVRMAEYVKNYPHPNKLIDYMDVLSADMQRRVKVATGIYRYIFTLENKRLLRYEADIYHLFHKHTIISEQDRKLLPVADKESIKIIPNGIEHDQITNVAKNYDLLFFGNLGYLSNVESAIFLAEKVVPELLKTHPNLTVLIAGAEPDKRVLALQNKQITISGWVDDKWACFASAKVFAAPMLISVGMQNKILEAMAVKVPCVVTTMANNAIGAQNGHEVLVADTPTDFAHAIAKLLDTPGYATEIAENAHNFITTNYGWQHTTGLLENYLKQ